jgi:hypothetical protein
MAFGKKKSDEQEPAVNLFEEEDEAAEAEVVASAEPATGQPAADDAPPAEESAPAPEPAPAADPLAGGADALLSLFQEDDGGGEDRGALLDLAGEVELADLLDDLRTVAVALKIAR